MSNRTMLVDDFLTLNARPVPGYKGYYATADGRVFSIMEMKRARHSDGYLRVQTFSNQVRKRPGVHTMVASAFIGPRPAGMVVRHLDGNKDNNSPENLKWGTHKENSEDVARHGILKGRRNWNAKLTDSCVIEIRKLRASGVRLSVLAKQFEVSDSTIEAVVNRRNWKHVE